MRLTIDHGSKLG